MNETMKRKLSIREIIGEKPKLKDGEKKREICTIGGVVKRWEPVETSYGQSIRFIGDFIAVNVGTGEVFRSNRVFLPKILEDEFVGSMKDGTSLEFASRISIIADDKSAPGYVYIAEPIVKAQESDQMKKLAELMGATKALPAPAAPAKAAAKAEPVKPAAKK